jgi:Zn-dependent peptidase ImmA (M78 family)
MAHDYRADSLKNSELRYYAKKARASFGAADHSRVDVLDCVKRPSIWTLRGARPLKFEIRSDADMGDDDGKTIFNNGAITIAIKRSVYHAAYLGEGRARNTIAHELGHAVLHDGPQMSRRATGNVRPGWLRPFESAEHHANVFAAAFLINDSVATALSSSDDISIEFGISLESASIYFQELIEERNIANNAERMRRIVDEFRESNAPKTHKITYINELCTACGKPTVFPIGSKFMCQTCDNVSDRFQDGDSAAAP